MVEKKNIFKPFSVFAFLTRSKSCHLKILGKNIDCSSPMCLVHHGSLKPTAQQVYANEPFCQSSHCHNLICYVVLCIAATD